MSLFVVEFAISVQRNNVSFFLPQKNTELFKQKARGKKTKCWCASTVACQWLTRHRISRGTKSYLSATQDDERYDTTRHKSAQNSPRGTIDYVVHVEQEPASNPSPPHVGSHHPRLNAMDCICS